MPTVRDIGDRVWSDAAAATLAELVGMVRAHAKDIHGDPDVDAVHDTRTSIRRLRTAVSIYGADADKGHSKSVERELRRVTRRLGAVRDLDILLKALDTATTEGGGDLDARDLAPLREAWTRERRAAADRLTTELHRRRFERALSDAVHLIDDGHGRSRDGRDGAAPVQRISHRAPGLVSTKFGELLGYEIDPLTADPADVHRLRIAAKQPRYTLEAFEDALEPGTELVREVTALQDAGGEMHDAIVAADRAKSTIDPGDLRKRERAAITAFADGQRRRAERQRPVVALSLRIVRGRAFRQSLTSSLAAMGHISPGR